MNEIKNLSSALLFIQLTLSLADRIAGLKNDIEKYKLLSEKSSDNNVIKNQLLDVCVKCADLYLKCNNPNDAKKYYEMANCCTPSSLLTRAKIDEGIMISNIEIAVIDSVKLNQLTDKK
jgi:hypothetical protein